MTCFTPEQVSWIKELAYDFLESQKLLHYDSRYKYGIQRSFELLDQIAKKKKKSVIDYNEWLWNQ